jgi:hypothetical protein
MLTNLKTNEMNKFQEKFKAAELTQNGKYKCPKTIKEVE